MKEIWKDIEGYEGVYQSSITRVLQGRYKQTGGYTFEYAE